MLTGEMNVDAWSNPSVWEVFMENVAVVVSTYQILNDALSHAFINMDRLSLLVFDEGRPPFSLSVSEQSLMSLSSASLYPQPPWRQHHGEIP